MPGRLAVAGAVCVGAGRMGAVPARGSPVRDTGRMLGADALILSVLGLGALVLKVWALADAIYRPGPYYAAAGKWNKVGWVVLLAVALALSGAGFLSLFGTASVIAAIVYLVDVRPAVRALKPGGGPWG